MQAFWWRVQWSEVDAIVPIKARHCVGGVVDKNHEGIGILVGAASSCWMY